MGRTGRPTGAMSFTLLFLESSLRGGSMAIPSWERCLAELRRDPLKVAAVGLAVGAGCLYAATRSTSFAVTVDPPRAESAQAIRQVSHELDVETESEVVISTARGTSRAGGARLVIPAVAVVDADGPGGTGLLRRVEPARFEPAPVTQTPVPPQRSAAESTNPVRLTGTIEPIL